ncbi:amidohydrolase family protein [bacterium]|nr:amidohydrolase family protein [candidate division CSSED10-310 bacterium]
MHFRYLWLLMILFQCLFGDFSLAETIDTTNQKDELLLKNLTVLDVINLEVLTDQHIYIKNGRIIGIYIGKSLPQDYKGPEMDLTGCTAIPGLIDAHCHLTRDTIQSLENALRHGITTVRDMAGDGELLKSMQTDVREERMLGPDIYFSAVMGGHDFMQRDLRAKLSTPERYELGQAPWMHEVTNSGEIPGIIRTAVQFGATGIKMYEDLSADQVKALSEEAHRQGLLVWSHSFVIPATVDDVIDARADVISHAPGLLYPDDWTLQKYGTLFMDRNILESGQLDRRLKAMKDTGMILDPTLAIFEEKIGRLEASDQVRNYRRNMTDLMRAVHKHKVSVVAGTDLELPKTQNDSPALYWELELLCSYSGMSPLECLQAATINGAKAIGIESRTGSITQGKWADLVILNRNPTQNISHVQAIRFVIKHGKIVMPAAQKGEKL